MHDTHSRRRVWRLVLIALGLLILVPLFLVWLLMRLSLPRPGARSILTTLSSEVRIDQDELGVPTIHGKTLADVLAGQGWITARDRLFQMDLMRRKAGGKLSELLGEKALPLDEEARRLGLADAADRAVRLMSPEHLKYAEAYCAGVNAYLVRGVMPFEVRLLHYRPTPWQPRDILLVVLGMFETLNHYENGSEMAFTALSRQETPEAFRFLTPELGFLDAPILADPTPLPLPAVPDASQLDVRTAGHVSRDRKPVDGSNAWAIAGSRTKSGKPLLAGDPHLQLGAPNIWYRARLEGDGLAVTGVTLPGVPGVVIGSNGDVAWSFTNSMVDNVDFVALQRGPDVEHFVQAGKVGKFEHREEAISLGNGKSKTLDVKTTPWGPVVSETDKGYLALEWAALDAEALSQLDAITLDRARSLDEIFRALAGWAGPVQNAMIATRDGHIAWTLAGRVPKRVGFDGRVTTPRDAAHHWDGYYKFSELPRLVDPPSGFLVNANQRSTSAGPNLYQWGNDWPSPARAYRIRELLEAHRDWTAASVADVQHDVVSPTHLWYRDRLVEALRAKHDASDWLDAVEKLVTKWDGRADKDSAAYVFLREFRLRVFGTLRDPLYDKLGPDTKDLATDLGLQDETIRALLASRPKHLLDARFADYDAALREAATSAAKALVKSPGDLAGLRWGERNRTRVRHPFAAVMPGFVASFFNFPSVPVGGDSLVINANHGNHGPSMRMVVDLGDPKASRFEQPGGQSGHVLSPHYEDQFKAWVTGNGTPLEPGPTVVTDVLVPHA